MTIEVRILHKETETELGRVEIENVDPGDPEFGTYSVRFAVDRIGALGTHQRSLRAFPRLTYNVLGLVTQAFATLDEEELKLEANPSNLARRFRRPRLEI